MEVKIINKINNKTKEEDVQFICGFNDKVKEFKENIKKSLNIKIPDERIGIALVENGHKTHLYEENRSLEEYKIREGSIIQVSDLGPQISSKMLYVIEYIGPFIIIPILYWRLGPSHANIGQHIALILSTLHYFKRIYESLFVHVFSHTYPMKVTIVNCLYYWGLYGLGVGSFLFSRDFKFNPVLPEFKFVWIGLFLFSEIQNLKCHMIQRNLKEENQGKKGIPKGNLFDYVTSANYTWEICSWIFFSLFVNLTISYVFTILGALIMAKWAIGKHKQMIKLFGSSYGKTRKAIIPFIL